jgi:hypothetical protein
MTAWISALVKRGIGGSSGYGVPKACRMGSSAVGTGGMVGRQTRCSANAWAVSVGLLAQVPCGVRRGGEGFVVCLRYSVVFHKE